MTASSAYDVRSRGTIRPDVMEVFANHAEISRTAHDMGMVATQPYDIEYGCDFHDPEQRAGL